MTCGRDRINPINASEENAAVRRRNQCALCLVEPLDQIGSAASMVFLFLCS